LPSLPDVLPPADPRSAPLCCFVRSMLARGVATLPGAAAPAESCVNVRTGAPAPSPAPTAAKGLLTLPITLPLREATCCCAATAAAAVAAALADGGDEPVRIAMACCSSELAERGSSSRSCCDDARRHQPHLHGRQTQHSRRNIIRLCITSQATREPAAATARAATSPTYMAGKRAARIQRTEFVYIKGSKTPRVCQLQHRLNCWQSACISCVCWC
jgi:hypothetical protein